MLEVFAIACMMQCNIDARGQAARMKLGIMSVISGLILVSIWFFELLSIPYLQFAALAAILGGLFAIFEAKTAWCVIRAMGFKTKI